MIWNALFRGSRICNGLAEFKLDKGLHVMTSKFMKKGNMHVDYLEFLPKGEAK